jgi:radical SAM protein with 4Fe4S-binding SPASM domain
MNHQSYNNFWQRLHKSAKDKGFPLRVMFELTYRCNFNCKHCYVPKSYRKRWELKTKEVFSVLDELKNIGCFYLGFTGGEPFLREDIMQILWYAKRKGFEVIIYTNGLLIDEKIANELSSLRPNKVDITIPAMTKTAFERISGVVGSRDKVFNAIDWLYKRKVNLGFKTCVLKENEAEIKDIQEFAASLGALHRLDDMLSPRLNGSMEPYKYRGTLLNANIRESNANPRECCAEDIRENSRSKISENSRLFKCGVGISQAAITPQGELKLCLMINYPRFKILHTKNREPNTDNQKLKEAWEGLKEFVSSIKPDENYNCNKCKLQNYCKWCPAKGWLYSKTFTSCEPESRKKASLTLPSPFRREGSNCHFK